MSTSVTVEGEGGGGGGFSRRPRKLQPPIGRDAGRTLRAVLTCADLSDLE